MRNKIFKGLLFLATAAVVAASVLIAVIMYQGSMTTMQRDLRQEATYIKMGLEQGRKQLFAGTVVRKQQADQGHPDRS